MSKPIVLSLIMVLLLSACSVSSSWEDEYVEESDRLLSDHVKAVWTLEDAEWNFEGKLIRVEIMKKDGEPIQDFEINHEKLMHLIIVSKDLSYFTHIHPNYKGNGVFEIKNIFPAGGEYKFIADFKPSNGGTMTKMEWMRVEGNIAEPVPLTVDEKLEKTVDGKRVTLSFDELEAKKEVTLTFHITDEKTNQPITDLEPYLGSIGHVVVISEDGERYLHVHALEDQGKGPDALFETEFPSSGIYKIWGQFQKDRQVFTVSYVVQVP